MMQIKNMPFSVSRISACMLLLCLCFASIAEEAVSLIGVQTRTAPGNRAQIMLEFSGIPPVPSGFALHDPARMIFDFHGVKNNLQRNDATQKISAGAMQGFNFIDSGSTTRLIVDVLNIIPYQIDYDRNKIIITLDNDGQNVSSSNSNGQDTITAVDFRRGDAGEGRVIIEFSGPKVPVDFREENNKLVVEFVGASITNTLLRNFDVKDFGTNIDYFSVEKNGGNVVLSISTTGDYENVSYQLDNEFVVEVRPLTADSIISGKSQKFKFTGEKISLNFQDIPIRSVLQLIADFVGLNMVISDTVTGNVTLRLENTPWDQALDYILSSNGLAKRESGNIMLIAPSEQITSREQLDLESQQQVQALSPLVSEYIQINYAKAADMAAVLKANDNSLLSARGQITVDERTNTILIKDTAANIADVRALLDHLDVPVKQVVIETQIVQTTDDLTDSLGIKFGSDAYAQLGKYTMGVAPTRTQARTIANTPSAATILDVNAAAVDAEGLNFDFLAVGDVLSRVGLAFARLPNGTLLDLELSASEAEAKTKTIARPKLMTLDQQEASIETGEEIPYTTVSQTGATPTTTFKKAVLKLQVTPQITPNDKIVLDLEINQDSPGAEINGQAGINTTALTTNVLVDNGETIVLGGIFKLSDTDKLNAVPYLSEIPVIGRLFSATSHSVVRTEILIFVTPRIAKSLFSR